MRIFFKQIVEKYDTNIQMSFIVSKNQELHVRTVINDVDHQKFRCRNKKRLKTNR